MSDIFQIGSFCFRIVAADGIPIPKNFLLFRVTGEHSPEYTYHLCVTHQLPLPQGEILAKRWDLMVYASQKGESRLLSLLGQKYYACYREISQREAQILVRADEADGLQIDTMFTSLFALERRMIERKSLILHCAYMVYQGKAILFSAPSETGKSTQANLWEKYRGSRTVNGDRALLRKINGIWHACGWPVCGSSEICHLGDVPIYAIVMLRQGKTNHVVRLSPVQAFSQLYAQITINQWNKEFVQGAIELIEDLIGQVPVWQLTCDISEQAVQCLETALYEL